MYKCLSYKQKKQKTRFDSDVDPLGRSSFGPIVGPYKLDDILRNYTTSVIIVSIFWSKKKTVFAVV